MPTPQEREENSGTGPETGTRAGARAPVVVTDEGDGERLNKYLPENMKTWNLIFDKKMIIILNGGFFVALLALFIVLITNDVNLNQTVLDYTQCRYQASSNMSAPDSKLKTGISLWMFSPANNTCTVQFQVDKSFNPSVHMYIRITNFYQNHQFYAKSQDPGQLKGTMYATARSIPSASSSSTNDCGWLLHGNCTEATANFRSTNLTLAQHNPDCRLTTPQTDPVIVNAALGSQYYPCGLAANSMFSDEFSDLSCISTTPCPVPKYVFSAQGIAWPEDAGLYEKTKWARSSMNASIPTMLIPPPMWRRAWPERWRNGYNVSNIPDLATWERFHVWMRKAAQPTFRKLWGINSTTELSAGKWQVSITDTWNATRFGGTKSLVYADIGILGPQSSFLWAVVLAFCLQCLLFTVIAAAWSPRENGNMNDLSWKKEQ